MKKWLCLFLSVVMLASCVVLTSCSGKKTDDEDGGSTVDTSAKTITMWVMTSDETTERAKELVSEEFTKITKSLYKTNVIIKFLTEDEYYNKLTAAIETAQAKILLEEEGSKALRKYLKAHKNDGKTSDQLTDEFYAENPQYAEFREVEEDDEDVEQVTEEETFLNEFGIKEIKYPEEKENQVDIFYLSGYSRYLEFYNNEWLASLSEELSSSSRKLTDYVSPSLLNGVQIDGGVYAIPNNVPIGEYTYMMIDKALFDEYYNKIDNVKTVADLGTFLNDMKNRNGDLSSDDPNYVVPLASTYDECLKMLVWYWQLGVTDRSVYEYYDSTNDKNAADQEYNNRCYALQEKYSYEIEVEKENADGTVTTETKSINAIRSCIQEGKLYKVNDDGLFVDKDGNVLNYSYAFDEKGGYLRDKKGTGYAAEAKGGMYLVDENGDPVTPANDKRVIEDAVTELDANANVKPTYIYTYNNDCDFSILGSLKTDPSTRTRGGINYNFDSLFTQADYRSLLSTLLNYDYKGFYGQPAEGQLSGVSFVKGDSGIKSEYEKNGVYVDPETGREFYVVVAEYPEASEEELYGNMFAVYSGSSYLSRSMEIITRINTNSELRNLLQYGILGQHYELNEDGTAHLLTDTDDKDGYGTYRMDIEKTGNCFIATPPEERGADAWTNAKIQNNDSLINPLLGFDFNTELADSEYGLDIKLIFYINKLSSEAKKEVEACATLDELTYLMSTAKDEDFVGFQVRFAKSNNDVKSTIFNGKFAKALNPAYDPEQPLGPEGGDEQSPDLDGASPFTVYNNWLTTYGYAAIKQVTD